MPKYCPNCGVQVQETDHECSFCGEILTVDTTFDRRPSYASDRNGIVLLLIFLFLPGVHYFLVGRFVSGVLFFITAGGFGIWWLIDLINILTGNFKDSKGNTIKL